MIDWFSKTEVKNQEVTNEEIVFCGMTVGTELLAKLQKENS